MGNPSDGGDQQDNVIRFPGKVAGVPPKPAPKSTKAAKSAKAPAAKDALASEPMSAMGEGLDLTKLDEDRRKALQIVLSGLPFVLVGIKSTGGGADFFTALAGEPSDLRNAQPHLSGVIERAYDRKGI